MSSDIARPAPNRLRELFSRWHADHRRPQAGIGWSRQAWQNTLPEQHQFLTGLPDPLDRTTVAEHGRSAAQSADAALHTFVAAMVWGYGRIGYGAFRTARVLSDNPHAPATLQEAAQHLQRDGGPAAFTWLKDNRLHHLGVSYATKYLFFCNATNTPPALILDRLVQRWLRQHADRHVRLNWHVGDYHRYLDLATQWAAELGIAPADVEYLMFTDAAADEPGSQWAATPLTTTTMNGPTNEGISAVLDAMDEAATAFTAPPGDANPAELDDFDQTLRHLRRIVLTRGTVLPGAEQHSIELPRPTTQAACHSHGAGPRSP